MWEVSFADRIGGGSPFASGSEYYALSLETRFSRHSGLELNLAMRKGTYLSIPLLYKFYSRKINFAVGVNVDIPIFKTPYYYPRAQPGIVLRLSKDIKIYKGLFVEPQIQINPVFLDFSLTQVWVGVGVGVKYRFWQSVDRVVESAGLWT